MHSGATREKLYSYHVIGSYPDDKDIPCFCTWHGIARHIKPGGYVLLSVMNMELTKHRVKHWFSIDSDAGCYAEVGV